MVHVDRSLLQGDVEVDEALIGGVRSGKRGRGAEGKELIVIAAECSGKKRVGRARIQRIPNASADVLEAFILANIAEGATIHTDGSTQSIWISILRSLFSGSIGERQKCAACFSRG